MNAKLCDFCLVDKKVTLATVRSRVPGLAALHACNDHRGWRGSRAEIAETGLKALDALETMLHKAQAQGGLKAKVKK